MAQFVSDHGDEVRVIGMGAQDSLALAEDFVSSTGTENVLMIWDESFESWNFYEVFGQPYAILVTPEGDVIEEWRGFLPVDEVLEVARA